MMTEKKRWVLLIGVMAVWTVLVLPGSAAADTVQGRVVDEAGNPLRGDASPWAYCSVYWWNGGGWSYRGYAVPDDTGWFAVTQYSGNPLPSGTYKVYCYPEQAEVDGWWRIYLAQPHQASTSGGVADFGDVVTPQSPVEFKIVTSGTLGSGGGTVPVAMWLRRRLDMLAPAATPPLKLAGRWELYGPASNHAWNYIPMGKTVPATVALDAKGRAKALKAEITVPGSQPDGDSYCAYFYVTSATDAWTAYVPGWGVCMRKGIAPTAPEIARVDPRAFDR